VETIEVRNQAELDKALKKASPTELIACVGDGYFDASGSARVHAWGSATVHASDSATVRASGSATVRASDSATVHASDSATVHATPYVAVHKLSAAASIAGGVLIEPPDLSKVMGWIEYHGVKVSEGRARLFKAVDDEWRSGRFGAKGARWIYEPGTEVAASDWNTRPVCGGGLHFVARPDVGLKYNETATRYVACEVKLADIVVIDPEKIKARVCKVLHEVDADGDEIAVLAKAPA
jgi:hypothetical protein